MPDYDELRATVEAFNANHPVGTPVTRYALIEPLREGKATNTRSKAWIMEGHSAMVMVDGVPGGVLLDSVVPLPIDGITGFPLDDGLKEEIRGEQFSDPGLPSGTA